MAGDRADRDGMIGGADLDRGRGSEGGDGGGPFLRILDSVLVFVLVGRILVGRRGVEQYALGDVAAYAQRRTALKQVVGVELGRVRGRCGEAVASGGDAALDHQRSADRPVERDSDGILAEGA